YLRGLKENVIMGRLIPAGTGMKYYRNVKVDYDPTENQKVDDEFDELADIRGGLELPPVLAGVPGVDTDDDFEGDEVTEEISLDEPEEEFDIDEAMKIDLEDDDEI
ncbi:MAG: hypothetical protein AAB288_01390, partial [Acidobacteriota bacterium]